MPRGTFTKISINMQAILTETLGVKGRSHIAEAMSSMEAGTTDFMRKFINQSCDSAEKWFNAMLENLSTSNIEQMGLRGVQVTLEYRIGSDVSYWDDFTDTTESNVLKMVDLLEGAHVELEQRLNHYFKRTNQTIGSYKRAECTILDTLDNESYKVSLCLSV